MYDRQAEQHKADAEAAVLDRRVRLEVATEPAQRDAAQMALGLAIDERNRIYAHYA